MRFLCRYLACDTAKQKLLPDRNKRLLRGLHRMKINTSRFGTLEIDESKIITFKQGIPGFKEYRRFVLLPHRGDSPFIWLQCIDRPELAFLTIDPAFICPDYSFSIPDEIVEDLDIRDTGSIETLVLVTIRNQGKDASPKVTVNLLGPIVINCRNTLAVQLVLDPKKYQVQFEIHPKKGTSTLSSAGVPSRNPLEAL